MKVKSIGKNIELTEALREVVDKKISKLSKYFAEDVVANTTLSVERNKHKIEVTIPFNGVTLRAEEKNEDMYAAIDLVLDKIERQIRKQKTKLQRKNHGDSLRFHNIDDYVYDDDNVEPRIVKTKRFAIKPMSTEEAILQMELLGHDFFVYKNGETSQVNVLYKRKDGNYGLIEQQF
ncbi:ribosomal subunit interface protein [Clostridium argentinense CDC 2741]|uniref:Ribosome hibernation promoting factor n=1 Tax=Clostridium argentinense CDC 2741 TaxID=1418104 RepID=A0A0C1R4B3_9CLOT|nr:ribosome-associated translation inhibitor RaiA [Clostridium argentinense]ARC86773.1 ribosomal subunit interface protein [Clostridium argentinense]KIE45341.1 ribosomal subunit interface protein [Clostridium argentinense CDC 2741]NFF38519.1 ribosome-associated translation inhibitor RaiA [Clostridium argentinense]NFP49288.1 ribosome-associated translation inhibitor RaiA [Clostridium argentinense]NFP71691.1 ribosome-associated translation inhibitor RaiA [Clostridium argentinense]